ncbi:MAG: 2-hydroxychromene-2-carboxylate isomerase [Gammaproteobacteria bacterium]|nr:2-hydroxychromene-2-carboxylate isomerase [Gammaproteobacteria bacterium]
MAKNNAIEFYFDPISPFAWLASTQLDGLVQHTGASVVARPVLFAGFLKALGHKGPAEIPAKRDYTFRDVLRRASRYGLTVEGPPQHPFNPLLSLRAATAIEQDELRLAFAKTVMHVAWVEGKDITVSDTIKRVANGIGIDGNELVDQAGTAEVKQKLIDNTEQALARGLFGVPSFIYRNELFWGDDRIEDLLVFADGQRIDEEKLNAILARASGADRK